VNTANLLCGPEHSMASLCVKATKRSIVDFHDMENQSYTTQLAVEDFEELAEEIKKLKLAAKDNEAVEKKDGAGDGGVDSESEVSEYHTDTDEDW